MVYRFCFMLGLKFAKLCRFACIAALSATFLSAGLLGQAVNESQEKEVFNYTFHVIFLDYKRVTTGEGIDLGINLSFFDAGKVFRITALAGDLTRAFKYTGSSNLVFYEVVINSEGKKEYQPIVKARMGKPGTKLVIVSKDTNGRLYAFPYDIDSMNFQKGELRVINLSRQYVAVRVGDEKQKIEPLAAHNFSLKGDQKRFLVRLAIAALRDDQLSLVENRRYAVSKERRKLILIHQKTNNPSELGYTSLVLNEVAEVENISDAEIESFDPAELNDAPDSQEDGGE